MEVLEQALALCEKVGDTDSKASTLCNLGSALMQVRVLVGLGKGEGGLRGLYISPSQRGGPLVAYDWPTGQSQTGVGHHLGHVLPVPCICQLPTITAIQGHIGIQCYTASPSGHAMCA